MRMWFSLPPAKTKESSGKRMHGAVAHSVVLMASVFCVAVRRKLVSGRGAA